MAEKQFGVAVKAIIKNKEEKYLLLHKSKDEDINPDTVDIPGGRIEWGEDLETALKREVKEETGLEIKIIKPARTWGFTKENLHLVGITYLAELVGGEIELSSEHIKSVWAEKEEILAGNYPKWMKEEFDAVEKTV